jgi:hypothetical protein
MSLVDRLLGFLGRRRTAWRLFYDGSVMECQIADIASAAVEIRYVYRGDLYHSFVHSTRADAEGEARQKRSELIAMGWSEHATAPHVQPTS